MGYPVSSIKNQIKNNPFISAIICVLIYYLKSWCFYMCPLAPGATAGAGISFSFLKNIFTVKTMKRPDHQLFLLRGDCFLHMDQVLDDLFFSDADGL